MVAQNRRAVKTAEARREGKVLWHTALALDSAQRLAHDVFFKRQELLARYTHLHPRLG